MSTEQFLQHKDQIASLLINNKVPLSEYHPISMFAWSDYFDYTIKNFDGALCLYAENDDGIFQILPPFKRALSEAVLTQSFEYMKDQYPYSNLARIENVVTHDALYIPMTYEIYSRPYEYCYWRNHIAHLKGNDYKSKRHDINVFEKNNYVYRAYHADDFVSCVDLFERWASQREGGDDIYQAMIKENRLVHAKLLQHATLFNAQIRVVEINGAIEAYTLGFELTKRVFCIYLEVANLEITGLPAFIFNAFCRDSKVQSYDFVNCMDDFSMDNIKETKLSYRPVCLLGSHTVVEKEM